MGIIFWQLMSLRTIPFEGWPTREVPGLVMNGERPHVDDSWDPDYALVRAQPAAGVQGVPYLDRGNQHGIPYHTVRTILDTVRGSLERVSKLGYGAVNPQRRGLSMTNAIYFGTVVEKQRMRWFKKPSDHHFCPSRYRHSSS